MAILRPRYLPLRSVALIVQWREIVPTFQAPWNAKLANITSPLLVCRLAKRIFFFFFQNRDIANVRYCVLFFFVQGERSLFRPKLIEDLIATLQIHIPSSNSPEIVFSFVLRPNPTLDRSGNGYTCDTEYRILYSRIVCYEYDVTHYVNRPTCTKS